MNERGVGTAQLPDLVVNASSGERHLAACHRADHQVEHDDSPGFVQRVVAVAALR